MANWTALKAAIAAVIKTNGNKEITGAVLQSTLNSIVSNLGENSTFKGIATPTTVPGTPDGTIFYLVAEKGVYSNFGGLTVDVNDGLCVLEYKTAWVKHNIPIATKSEVQVIKSDVTYISDATVMNGNKITDYSLSWEQGFYYDLNGVKQTNSGWGFAKVAIINNENVLEVIGAIGGVSSVANITIMDSNSSIIKSIHNLAQTTILKPSSDWYYIVISRDLSGQSSVLISEYDSKKINDIVVEQRDYINNRRGTGLIIVRPKNLFNRTAKNNIIGSALDAVTGLPYANADWNVSDYIKVSPGTLYTLSHYSAIVEYDSYKSRIKGTSSYPTDLTTSFTTDSNTMYIRFCFRKSTYNTQLELGGSATSYVKGYPIRTLEIETGEEVLFNYDLHDQMTPTYSLNRYNYVTDVFGVLRTGGIVDTTPSDYTNYTVSDFIEVSQSTDYAIRYCGAVVEYDSAKTPLNYLFGYSGGSIARTFKTGTTTKYIRFGSSITFRTTNQVELGTVFSYYAAYTPYAIYGLVKGKESRFKGLFDEYLPDAIRNILSYTPRKNLFNKYDIATNSVLRDGYVETPFAGWNVSRYIEVEPGTDYYLSWFGAYSEYDSEKNKLTYDATGYGNSDGMKAFTTNVNTKFIRICCSNARLSFCQLELGSELTNYEVGGWKIFDQLKTGEPVLFKPDPAAFKSVWAGKKYMSLGDSITYRNHYQGMLSNNVGIFAEINNKGVSGRQVGNYIYEKDPDTGLGTNLLIEPSILNSYDLITFMGYANNYGSNTPLGNFSDSIGIKEVAELTVNSAATADGNLSIILNGLTTTVGVLAGDTIENIIAKINNTIFSNWGVTISGTTKNIFSKRVGGTNTAPVFDGGTTGVTGTFQVTTTGTAATVSFYAQVKTIVEYLSTYCKDKAIVGIGALQMAGYFGNIFNNPNSIGLTTLDYNDALKDVCQRYAIPFIDLYRIAGVNPLNYSLFYDGTDWIHPNYNYGMKRMADIIAKEINNLRFF